MATFIPVEPRGFNRSFGEEVIYKALHQLPEGYYVFYSLEWYNNGNHGEADFVLFHPQKGLLTLEVKSGGIDYSNGTWNQTNTATKKRREIGDPISQARRSMFRFKEMLSFLMHGREHCVFGYAVWFPSISFSKAILPMNCEPEMVLDIDALLNPHSAIDKVFNWWESSYGHTRLDNKSASTLINILAPHYSAVPSMKLILKDQEYQFVRLTQEQSTLMLYLDEQRTATIHGSAGTGKTMLALEKARRLSEKGESTLFLCYNSFLKNFLSTSFPIPNITYHTIHTLAQFICGNMLAADMVQWPEQLAEYLSMIDDEDDWLFQNVIIDEGQDIPSTLIDAVYKITKRHFYFFFDRNQQIQNKEIATWVTEVECRLVLQKNCRNTKEIADTTGKMVGMSITVDGAVRGDKPTFYLCESNHKMAEKIQFEVLKLIKETDIKPEEIVILTCVSEQNSALNGVNRIGSYSITHSFGEKGILCTTVRKFKGLEAKAVFLIDVTTTTLQNKSAKMLLYVGGSRAKHILSIFSTLSEDNIDVLVEVLADGQAKLPRNKRGLERLLSIQVK